MLLLTVFVPRTAHYIKGPAHRVPFEQKFTNRPRQEPGQGSKRVGGKLKIEHIYGRNIDFVTKYSN